MYHRKKNYCNGLIRTSILLMLWIFTSSSVEAYGPEGIDYPIRDQRGDTDIEDPAKSTEPTEPTKSEKSTDPKKTNRPATEGKGQRPTPTPKE